MRPQLSKIWDDLRTSFWFLPAAMTGLSVGVYAGMIYLDVALADSVVTHLPLFFSGDAEDARKILSTVAGSMITVAGVVFSITVVSLTLASQQFGPRMLRSFMHDVGNQIVFGTFLSTFLYCLLVLRTVREDFVPHLAATGGVFFAVLSIGVLIYFIHHVAESIQGVRLIASVSEDLHESIDRLFPERLGRGIKKQRSSLDEYVPEGFEADALAVEYSGNGGYLQVIDSPEVMRIAEENDLFIRIYVRPGDFVMPEATLVKVSPASTDSKVIEQVKKTFTIGRQRTPIQDTEFVINQIVQAALKALSPAINDPFTAINCIDRLGAALSVLAGRAMPSPLRYDSKEQPRVIAIPENFTSFAETAFGQIRQYGSSNAPVVRRLLETITVIARHARRAEDREALLQQVKMIEQAGKKIPEGRDRVAIELECQTAVHALIDRQDRE